MKTRIRIVISIIMLYYFSGNAQQLFEKININTIKFKDKKNNTDFCSFLIKSGSDLEKVISPDSKFDFDFKENDLIIVVFIDGKGWGCKNLTTVKINEDTLFVTQHDFDLTSSKVIYRVGYKIPKSLLIQHLNFTQKIYKDINTFEQAKVICEEIEKLQ